MKKLIIMQGLPASGKSTKAAEYVAAGAVRINKDLLRTMLHFDTFTRENEMTTFYASQLLARELLMEGNTVVIDDTNLNPRTLEGWSRLAFECKADAEIVYLNTPRETCIARDALREKKVGAEVINEMAQKYGK